MTFLAVALNLSHAQEMLGTVCINLVMYSIGAFYAYKLGARHGLVAVERDVELRTMINNGSGMPDSPRPHRPRQGRPGG